MDNNQKICMTFSCSQNWDKMEIKNNEHYCNQCNKTIIDFSTVDIQNISNSVISKSNSQIQTCGSFYAYQLDKPSNDWRDKLISFNYKINSTRPTNNFFKKLGLYFLTVTLLLTGCARRLTGKVCAKPQTKPTTTEQTQKTN